jgi:hypothetical protein
VVEHSIGNGEVDSSILSGSTINPPSNQENSDFANLALFPQTGTKHDLAREFGAESVQPL